MSLTSRAVTWIALVIWMLVIFALSAQPAAVSGGLSATVAAIVTAAIDRAPRLFGGTALSGGGLGDLQHALRKTAHFLEYLVLGSLALLAVRPGLVRSRPVGIRTISTALLLCVGYAVTDELHQLFVPGRAGRWQDVLIDSAGALSGILLVLAGYWAARARRTRCPRRLDGDDTVGTPDRGTTARPTP